LALPAWFAATVQLPSVRRVTVVPDTEQTPPVSELNVTVSPDDAVADTVKGGSLTAFATRAPNVMVWLALVTVKPRETCGAAL